MKKIKGVKMLVFGLVIGLFMTSTAVFAVSSIRSATFNDVGIIFNGEQMELPMPLISVITEENPDAFSNYMPVRAVLEAMGYVVGWDGSNVLVTSPAADEPTEEQRSTDVAQEEEVEYVPRIYHVGETAVMENASIRLLEVSRQEIFEIENLEYRGRAHPIPGNNLLVIIFEVTTHNPSLHHDGRWDTWGFLHSVITDSGLELRGLANRHRKFDFHVTSFDYNSPHTLIMFTDVPLEEEAAYIVFSDRYRSSATRSSWDIYNFVRFNIQ